MKAEKKFDSTIVGMILGIVLPVITMIIFWQIRYEGSFSDFLGRFQRLGMLSKVLSLCTIPNLALFFLFIWTDRSYSSRGVIFASIVVAIVMVALKFA